MRAFVCLSILVVLAGCTGEPATQQLQGAAVPPGARAESAPPAPEPAPPVVEPSFPRALGSGRAEVSAGKCVPADLPVTLPCRPVMVMVKGVSFDVSARDSERARTGEPKEWALLAEWAPANPTAASLGVRLMEGQRLVAYGEGPSPLRLGIPAGDLLPARYSLDIVPASGVVVNQSVLFTLDLQPGDGA